ncbi:MAG: ATP-binding cassette domain-containing protein [Eubacterium sp.]|nr:ATP-binding cassette domain-containing protein [Eubacterium sp.]
MHLEIKDGSVSRNGIPVLSHFSFEIKGTEKAAVVGRNGAGKTTLLEVLCGRIDLDSNEKNPGSGMICAGAFTTGILDQNMPSEPDLTLGEAVVQAVMDGKPADYRYEKDRFYYEQLYDRMLTGFGIPKDAKGKKLSMFSGGEQRKIMLIRLLLSEPDLLLLDEPTNHLDLESVEWLEQYIRQYPKAVLLVSHDRYFINRTADVIWEAEGGKLTRYPGNYTHYKEEKVLRCERQWKAYERQQAEIQREKNLIIKFKNKPRKAAFARSRKKLLDRMVPVEKPVMDTEALHTKEIIPARPGSKWVLECVHLKIGYKREQPLKEISFRVRRGQKIGIIGANGSGKSTFLKTVAGKLAPLEGTLRNGVHIDSAYFDQLAAEINGEDAERTVLAWFQFRFPLLQDREAREVLAGYLFRGRDLAKKVKSLSGGERARLVLAVLLYPGPNFLILDEPTNHMDIPAKEVLESVFRSYKGTILFVSHDRYFLSQVADSLLLFEPGNSQVQYYPFGYDHFAEQKEKAQDLHALRALRSAEDQRLIDELKAVPKPEHFRLKEISTEEAVLDWRFQLTEPDLEQAEQNFISLCERVCMEKRTAPETLEEYMQSAPSDLQELEKARDIWTARCLDWYEVWLDTRAGREAPDGEQGVL